MDGYLDPADQSRGRTQEGDLDPDKIAHELEEWGRRFAERRATADLLRKQESVLLSTLVLHYRQENPKLSRADAMDLAKTSEEYATHLDTQVEAVRQKDIAQGCWKAAQARFEAMRTAEATRRAEMQTFRGHR